MAIGFPGLYGVHALLFCLLAIASFSFTLNVPLCDDNGQAQAKTRVDSFVAFNKSTMFYIYLACTLLALLVSAFSWYFNRKYLPNEFATLGRVMSAVGSLLRISLTLLTIIHWLVLLLVLYESYTAISMPECVKTN